MFLAGRRSFHIMRTLCALILCLNCVYGVSFDGTTCILNGTDTFKSAIGVCEEARNTISDIKVTDLSGVSREDFDSTHDSFFSAQYLKMVGNSEVVHFNVGILKAKQIEIRRNKNLDGFSADFKEVEEIRISGNPRLSPHDIEWLNDQFSDTNDIAKYIQEEGECEFDDIVKDVNEFAFCKYVKGDLIMENTIGASVPKLHKITGCLRIINTELKDIDFLDGISYINKTCQSGKESDISGNRYLWIHSPKKEALRKIVDMEITIHPKAVGTCSSDEALSKDFDCTVVLGDLNIIKSDVSIHNLKTITDVRGFITIQGTDFDSISFPKLTSFGHKNEGSVLMVIDNPKLTSLDFPNLKRVETNGKLLIILKGNKILDSADSLKKQFSKIGSGKNLEIECNPDKEIEKLSQLNGCTSVFGDLVLKGTIDDSVPKITKIDGCLKVIDTSLKNLEFPSLEQSPACSTESEISGNKELCLPWPVVKELSHKIGKINYKPDEACDIACTLSEFEESTACNVFEGDLAISGLDSNNGQGTALSKLMVQVKRITGKLTISGNTDATIEFPELVSVGNPSLTEESILIDGNKNLKGISIPKLKSVETGGGVAITVKELKLAKDQAKIFKDAAGEKEFKLECDFSNAEVTDFADLEYCTSVKGDLLLKSTQGGFNTKIESIGGCLQVIDTDLDKNTFFSLIAPLDSEKCQSGEKSEVKGNKNLCLEYKEIKDAKSTFGKTVELSFDESCDIVCTLNEFEESTICNGFNGDLAITGFDSNNGKGSTLAQIMAKTRKITGKLTISGNTDATIEFPELVSVGNPSLTEEPILIDGNGNLKGISIPKLKTVETGGSIAIVVAGFKMEKDQAKFFKDVAGGKGLKLECDFSNTEVKDFAELEYCTSVKGDLLLKGTQGVLSTKIESIGGCLQVINTDLKKDMFLSLVAPLNSEKCQSGEKSEVKGNKNLCLEWNEIKDAILTFGKAVELSFDESCEFPCTEEEFAEDGSYCDQINGDLKINGETDPKVSKAVFEKVKRVKGSITISDTLLKEIEIPLLSLIENNGPGTTLILTGNNVLRKFTMPSLKKITSSNSDAVLISNNDGFRMSNELKTVLEAAITPGDTVVYECHESGEISDFSRLEGCTRMSSDLLLKGQISGNAPISKIGFIAGCLKVENTDLSSLDFLRTDGATGDLRLDGDTGFHCAQEHFIKNNENLCIPAFLERQLQEIYPQLKISDNKPRDQCPVFCSSVNGSIPDHECNVVKGELRIENNCSFDQKLALVEQIYGGLVVKDCSLSSLKDFFPKLRNISNSGGIPLVLENVENYTNLTDLIQFKLESENSEGHLLKIVTNLEIPYMVVADLKAHFGSKRVEVSKIDQIPDGVCIFVDSAEEVKNCKKIEGDLILNEKTNSVSTDFTEITGCLVVRNINMENYEFLTKIEKVGEKCRWNSGETEISNNSCIPYEIRRRTSGKIKELVETKDNKKECFECTGGIIQGQECKVIIGDLEIKQGSAPEVVTQLEGVKEIYGRLIIKNSNLPQISLPQLTKIDASESEEPAIEITGNNELSTLQIPSLANATSKGKVLVKIEGNKKLKKTAELTEKLGKATGSQCGEGKDTACQFSQVKEASKASEDKEKTTEEGVPKTVLIVLGIIGAILLVVGVGGIAVMVVLMKKKRAKKAKKGKGPGKPPMSTMSKIDSKQFPKLPSGDDKSSKTKSMAVENGRKSQSEKKNVSKDGAKGEETKEPADQKKEGAAEENAPKNIPNAS